MDFELSEEQQRCARARAAVRRPLRFRAAQSVTRGAATAGAAIVWRLYAELGLLGLPFAEEHGGFGGGPVETMIVMEASAARWCSSRISPRWCWAAGLSALGGSASSKPSCSRRSPPASCFSPSPMPSGRRATTSPTWHRARARRRGLGASTARRAWCCTATAPTNSSSRRASPAARRDRDGIGLFLVDATRARRVAARLSDARTDCARRK